MRILLSHRNDLINPATIGFSHSVDRALMRAGHSTKQIGYKHFYRTPSDVPEFQSFDALIHIDNGRQDREMTRGISEFNGPKICWLVHPHSQYDLCRDVAREFDFVFTAVRDSVTSLSKDLKKTVTWLPLAVDRDFRAIPEVTIKFDVGFIGREQNRADILRNVIDRYNQRNDSLEKSHQKAVQRNLRSGLNEVVSVPASASPVKIKYNIAEYWGDAYRHGLLECRAIFNKQHSTDLNFRTFEAMALGRVLITDANAKNGQDQLFEEYVHFLAYENTEELLDCVVTTIMVPKMCQRIVTAACQEVFAYHTFDHRVETMLAAV
jgi:spore maturation protein CgeB